MENETNTNPKGLSKNFWIIIGSLLLIAIIVVVVVLSSEDYEVDTEITTPAGEETEVEEGEEVPELDDMEAEETDFTDPQTSVVPGGDSVVDDRVVDREGQEVRTDVEPMSSSAPQQTGALEEDELADEVIRLEVSAEGWEPAEFSVNSGDVVTISVTSSDTYTHIFKFDDENLKSVAVGVGPGETRAITFNAPEETGEYSFYCDVPGHERRGEVGVMIVE